MLVLAACGQPMFSDRGVEVTTRVDRQTFFAGDTAQIIVSALNEGSQTVTLNAKTCPAHFQVKNALDVVVAPVGGECSSEAVLRDLVPGDSLVQEYRWRLDDEPAKQLPAGEYRLRGLAYGEGGLRAQSNDVRITIAAARK
jgi:hypothetical protein